MYVFRQCRALFDPTNTHTHTLPLLPLQVIMFDPMYDSYTSMARRAGATIVPVKLALPDFHVPRETLEAAFSTKTKFILVNTPHNPSGKVGCKAG